MSLNYWHTFKCNESNLRFEKILTKYFPSYTACFHHCIAGVNCKEEKLHTDGSWPLNT